MRCRSATPRRRTPAYDRPVPGERSGTAISARLSAFVEETPLERRPILAFLSEAARELPAGARVLDAGAGEAPYRELFEHCEYVTSDWASSVHEGARSADVVAPIHDLPLGEATFDAVINTQVLEHVPDPFAALRELRRVLVPGGRLWLTAPLVGELHEEPYDFFRYTSHGLASLLDRAGFEEIEVEPLAGYFTTLAALARNCGLIIGVGRDRSDLGRRLLAAGFRVLARGLPRLDRLDERRALPLGYGCRAVRPERR